MLPSLYQSSDDARPWNVGYAAACGAVIGLLAAVFKTLGPLGAASGAASLIDRAVQIAGAMLAFAFLCAGAASLRNFIARRLIWRDGR
jgi:uncharacterized membrane protein YfcA